MNEQLFSNAHHNFYLTIAKMFNLFKNILFQQNMT